MTGVRKVTPREAPAKGRAGIRANDGDSRGQLLDGDRVPIPPRPQRLAHFLERSGHAMIILKIDFEL